MDRYRCKNEKCKKTFPVYARISTEKTPTSFIEAKRIIVDKPCCPFCESIEFEVIEEKKL